MRVLFLDCFSGISGDMSVGALLDLGLSTEHLATELKKLGLDDEYHLHIGRQSRQHIEGVKFDVHAEDHAHNHPHNHHHHPDPRSDYEHEHGRSFRDIESIIAKSLLSDPCKSRAISIFRRIAVAEGKIHGMPPESVTFHEVGAIDSIVDITAFCIGIEALGIETVFASFPFEGSGFIECAHGRFPLPAPATLEILSGIPLTQIDEPMEFITPTGAAILAEFVQNFGPMPPLAPEKIGYGIGTRHSTYRPNVLRAILGSLQTERDASDTVVQIETNLDDCLPEVLGAVTEKLLAHGALDVFLTPVQMKKNRPGTLLTVLCDPFESSRFSALILRETPAFGLRMHECRRIKLQREFRSVEIAGHTIATKLGFMDNVCIRATPEFESCRTAAEITAQPIDAIYRAASAAAQRFLGTNPSPPQPD